MDFNDGFGILEEFNRVCGILAHDFVDTLVNSVNNDKPSTADIPMNVNIPDIDLWWSLMNKDGKDFSHLHMDAYKRLSPEKQQRYISLGEEILSVAPGLSSHYKQKVKAAKFPLVDQLRYLPHEPSYAYPTLLSLDGFAKLNNAVVATRQNISMGIYFIPQPLANDLHDVNAYQLVVFFEAMHGVPIKDILKPTKQRFH